VTDFGSSQNEQTDDRIAKAIPKVTKMGTVTSRDIWSDLGPSNSRCLVTFDADSGVSHPVKCPESVIVDVGDRVGLVYYEHDWIITINYSLRTLCDAMNGFQWGSGTTTSATFVDMPSSPSLTFVKARADTFLRIWVGVSLWVTSTPTVATIGMSLLSGDLSVNYDETLFHRAGQASIHHDYSGWITTGALHADTYTATARWLRLSGAGTLTVDGNDSISIHIIEVVS
jgi:hypothetical protein